MPRSAITLKVGMMRTSTGSISVTKIIMQLWPGDRFAENYS